MSDSGDPSVKKRSLSSYLSNVTSRREELEKLKKIQEEQKHENPDEQQKEQEGLLPQEETKLLEAEDKEDKRKPLEQLRAATEHTELDRKKDEEHENKDEEYENNIKQEESLPSSLQKVKSPEHEEVEHITTLALNKDADGATRHNDHEAASASQQKREDSAYSPADSPGGVINRNTLTSILQEPISISGQEATGENNEALNRNDEVRQGENENQNEDEEIDSDAPTEPASPPRPKRGRLIRGDRLSSISPRHTPFDNGSDSDLSDIDELKSVHISSSIIHGDSSPNKHTQYNYQRFQEPSSPRIVRKSLSPKKSKPHVAVSKVPKQKKGVYRDAGGRTRLQISCDKGNYEFAKKLIEQDNYDVNDQDNAGNTALHEAALNGHLDLVKLLTNNGANVNVQSYEMFKDTPLIDASANGHLDVVMYLLEHGADPTIPNAKGLTAYESIEEDSDLDDQEREIVCAIKKCLRSATRKWKTSDREVKTLSDNGIKLSEHLSPVVKRQSEEPLGDYDFFWTDITSRAGKEKLFRASKEGVLAYVGAYLENGGRVDVKSFLEAVKFGHEDITSLFLAFGAQVNIIMKDGTTALMSAVGRGHLGTVKLLLEAGADPTKKDKKGRTALYYAKNSSMGIFDTEEVKLVQGVIEKVTDNVIDNSKKGLLKAAENVKEERDQEERSDKENQNDNKEQITNEEDKDDKGEDDDEDENVIRLARKRRTISPDRLELKRPSVSAKAVSTQPDLAEEEDLNDASRSPKKPRVEMTNMTANVKVHEETPEEREQRVKAEEEYIQKRLQNKKKREQELLKKLALDEEKREKERVKQKIEETKRREEIERQKNLELQRRERETELVKRREIRSLYPLGLKLIDFQDKSDYMNFLPLYYTKNSNELKYVLDLQVCVILKDAKLLSSETGTDGGGKIRVEMKHKKQLWNMLKFIFLCGGNNVSNSEKEVNDSHNYSVKFDRLNLETRINYELQELMKFTNLPLHWIKWDDIIIDDESKKEYIEKNMAEIALIDAIDEHESTTKIKSLKDDKRILNTSSLPIKLQHRRSVSSLIDESNTRPLW